MEPCSSDQNGNQSENDGGTNHDTFFFREGFFRRRRRGTVVLGGLDEGQIPAVCAAGAEPEHGGAHPGYISKVKSCRKLYHVLVKARL